MNISELVTEIHARPGRAALVVTGAGARALAWLFAEPGASRTVLDAQVPYSVPALNEYTGGPSDQHVSAFEALRMAGAAFKRAQHLASRMELPEPERLVGVACTAAIATDRVRRGEDRCHVAWTDGLRRKTYSVVFAKEARDRHGEEEVSSRMVLNALAEAKQVDGRVDLPLLEGESLEESS